MTCPETHKPEAVDVAAAEAGLGGFFNEPTLRLNDCSRVAGTSGLWTRMPAADRS